MFFKDNRINTTKYYKHILNHLHKTEIDKYYLHNTYILNAEKNKSSIVILYIAIKILLSKI